MQLRSFLLCLAALLTACASMSPEECRHADWLEVGRSDAQRGQTPDHLARHRKSCAKAGYPVNAERYYSGYQRGLVDYCNATTAFRAARSGHPKPIQCRDAAVQSADFTRAYQYGLRVRDTDAAIQALQQDIASLHVAIDDHESHLHAIQATLEHEELDNYEAIALHEESKVISAQIAHDLEQRDVLAAELVDLQHTLENMMKMFHTGRYE